MTLRLGGYVGLNTFFTVEQSGWSFKAGKALRIIVCVNGLATGTSRLLSLSLACRARGFFFPEQAADAKFLGDSIMDTHSRWTYRAIDIVIPL